MTAPDSYRIQMPAAEDELRHVAGTQLDGRLVWLFATQVRCAAARATTSGTSPTSRPSCRSSAASAAGAPDGPFVLGPPTR